MATVWYTGYDGVEYPQEVQETMPEAEVIDVTKPANLRLTRQQKQVLAYVRENQGATAIEVANAVGCRPYHAMGALEALERFRWVATGGKAGSCYGWRWELSEQAQRVEAK